MRRSRSFALAVALALACVLVPRAAAAGGTDGAAAEALFKDGREAMKRGDFATACARFTESQRLDPAPGTLLNLADCEAAIGKLASAWAHLEETIDELPPNDERVAIASTKAAALEPRLPRLRVRLAPDAPQGSIVRRDGVEIGGASLGLPIPVDPGAHVVTVAAPGRTDRSYSVDAVEAKTSELVVAPGAPVARAASGSSSTLGWILVGAGGAAVGVGTVTGVLAIRRNAIVGDHCDASHVCDQDGVDAAHEGRTFDVASTVSFIVAGVLVAGGIAWLVTHPRGEPR